MDIVLKVGWRISYSRYSPPFARALQQRQLAPEDVLGLMRSQGAHVLGQYLEYLVWVASSADPAHHTELAKVLAIAALDLAAADPP